MIFDKKLVSFRPGMTLNNGDISESKMWLKVGSRECVCPGGGGKGSLTANVDSDSFNGARTTHLI